MVLGSLGEVSRYSATNCANSKTDIYQFILGNTFPFVVFGSFGAFWLSFAATLQPFYNAYGAYAPDPSMPAGGLETTGFTASFGKHYNILQGPRTGTQLTPYLF